MFATSNEILIISERAFQHPLVQFLCSFQYLSERPNQTVPQILRFSPLYKTTEIAFFILLPNQCQTL